MAVAATTGDNKIPKTGYRVPAAIEIPNELYKRAKINSI